MNESKDTAHHVELKKRIEATKGETGSKAHHKGKFGFQKYRVIKRSKGSGKHVPELDDFLHKKDLAKIQQAKVGTKKLRKLTRDKSYTNLPTLENLVKQKDFDSGEKVSQFKEKARKILRGKTTEDREFRGNLIRKLKFAFVPFEHHKAKVASKSYRANRKDPLTMKGD
mmetsp:Transcript_39114/g.44765  ORF Transcript_39114/g.44765 Transcript_39114/m.44765 type:complete len:169 (-) Transcript_39114:146-652(-)